MNFFFVLLFRLLWQIHPSLWNCAIFWAAIAFSEYQYLRANPKVNWWTKSLLITGASMNAIVTLANNGTMPYLGTGKPYSLWVVGTGKHLLFLCDRFNGFSLGDFFILGSFAIGILLWLRRILAGGDRTPKIP